MRAVLFILILAVAVVIVALGTGMVDIDQTRGVEVPDVEASRNGVSASGGQAPAFDIETGSVQVGTTQANVTVPSLEIQPAGNDAQGSGNTVVAQ